VLCLVLGATFAGSGWAQFDLESLPDIAIAAHTGASNWAVLSPDGLYLSSCGDDGTVRIWKTPDLALYKTVSTPTADKESAEFTSDVAFMYEAGTDGKVNVRKVGKTAGFGLSKTLQAGGPVKALVLSSDGSLLAAAVGKTVKLWRMKDYFLKELRGPADKVQAIAMSGDLRYLAAASADSCVYLYDLATKALVKKHQDEKYPYTAVALSRSGEYLLYGNYTGRLTVRQAGGDTIIRTLIAHSRYMTACAVSGDDTYLATASILGEIKIWKMGSFALLKTLSGQAGGVLHLSFSSDGRWLVSSGTDGSVQLWDLDRLFP